MINNVGRELRLLFWLRWRQFRDSAVYWLRVAGYQPGGGIVSQAIYLFYLLLIGLFWAGTVFSWIFGQATYIGNTIQKDFLVDVLMAIPWGVLIIQVFVLMIMLRSTPLKLSFPDTAYLASSPIDAVVPVILGFGRQVILRVLLLGSMTALIASALIRPYDTNALAAAFRAGLMALLLVVLTWAAAWALGLLRLVHPRLERWRFLWAIPLILFGLAYLLPDAILWPGRAVVLAIYGDAPLWLYLMFTGLAIGAVVALVRVGNRVNMMQAADESVFFARIQALGFMAWIRPQLVARVYLRETQAARKPFLRLPKATGWWMLVTRAGLSYVRHPIMLGFNLVWGAAMTGAAILIIGNNLPVQLTIGWLLIAGITPPAGLLHVFRTDVEERFLRQLLPVNGLELFAADVVLPMICLIAGGSAVWILRGYNSDITVNGLLFIAVIAILIGMIGAVSLTNPRVLQTRILTTIACFAAMLIAWNSFNSPTAALMVASFATIILGGILVADG
ncbi:MAG: hypothetical protein H7Y09_01265 [Chitinophagaceae bacterium]|nr:hypothetical protein [Anaerolineae bacterium]